jgi:hypothetical protein
MKTLAKEFDRIAVVKAGPAYTIQTGTGTNWRQLGGPAGNAFVASTYFDLAGMSMEEKTLFFSGAALQEVLNPSKTTAAAGDIVQVADIMSTTPLRDQEAANYIYGANLASGDSTLTFEQTIYGRVRHYNIDLDNQAGSYMIALSDNQTGSLAATASDRIYCYRVLLIIGSDGRYDLFGARYLLRAEAKEEPEYEYLMRLKRSYELQNQPDRD